MDGDSQMYIFWLIILESETKTGLRVSLWSLKSATLSQAEKVPASSSFPKNKGENNVHKGRLIFYILVYRFEL